MKRMLARAIATAAACMLACACAGCGTAQQSAASSDTASGDAPSHTEVLANRAPLTKKAFQAAEIAAEEAEAPQPSATVLVYLNGSDLESVDGEATIDIEEMLESNIGKNANVVIETLGTSRWQNYGIASDHTQRYAVKQGNLELVDDSLGQLDTTSADTLSEFISWGVANYPAQRYILLLWDHGAGPVWGIGYDEFQGDYAALTLDEIQSALAANEGVHFDIIGMDCCLMSSLEMCCVLAPFCDYAVLSEDFEPGVGWSYETWMSMLEADPAISSLELGALMVDDMISAAEANPQNGEATLALIDESVAPLLYSTWVEFAYANEDALLGTNFSQETLQRGRASGARPDGFGGGWPGPGGAGQGGPGEHAGWGGSPGGPGGYGSWSSNTSNVTMSDYYVTDVMAVASAIDSDEAQALEAALGNAVVHFGRTSGEVGMTGIGVTLPYGDAEFYDELVNVFTACGFDSDYIKWLETFVNASGIDNHYDYERFDDAWSGWDHFNGAYDWRYWSQLYSNRWNEYERSGWYDHWYDDRGGGWYGYFRS